MQTDLHFILPLPMDLRSSFFLHIYLHTGQWSYCSWMVYPCECKVASVHSTSSGPMLIEALFSQLVGKIDCTQLLLYSLGFSSGDEGMCKCLEIVSVCKLPGDLPTYFVHQHLPFATFFSKLLVLSWMFVEMAKPT